MKKTLKGLLFLIISFQLLNCNVLNGQSPNDELGIKNERDFVSLIKSITNNQNILSETPSSKTYRKVIKTSTHVITINILLSIDKSGYNLDQFQGDIYIQDLSKYQSNGPRGFRKGNFNFLTFNDIIAGNIVYYTGPAPYSNGPSLVQQYMDSEGAKQVYSSVPNVYAAKYQFEVELLQPKKEAEEAQVDISEMDEEYKEASEKVKQEQKVEDSINFLEHRERHRYKEVGGESMSNGLLGIDKFKIVSSPKLIDKRYFWEGNGSKNFRDHGYIVKLNPAKQNDTLSFKVYSPKRNGKIIDYVIRDDRKIQVESGYYKDGKPIGERIKYEIKPRGNVVIVFKTNSDNDGNLIKEVIYGSSIISHPDNKIGHDTIINFPSRIINFNPKSNKINGLYEEYQLIPYYVINKNDFNILSTPILKISGVYQEGKKVGEWKEFYNNKQLKSRINYDTGESETYNEKGELVNKTYKRS